MAASLYWIGGERLAVAPRPRAGDWLEDEIASWQVAGVATVVCLLEDAELAELDLLDEGAQCVAHGIEFLRFPIPDRGLPANQQKARALAADIATRMDRGQGVLIHCRAGIGRTGLLACAVLRHRGASADEALRLVSEARGLQVPDTQEQRNWIVSF